MRWKYKLQPCNLSLFAKLTATQPSYRAIASGTSLCIGKNKPSVTIRTNSGSMEQNKGVVKRKRNKGGEGEVRESRVLLDSFYQFAEGVQVGFE